MINLFKIHLALCSGRNVPFAIRKRRNKQNEKLREYVIVTSTSRLTFGQNYYLNYYYNDLLNIRLSGVFYYSYYTVGQVKCCVRDNNKCINELPI